MIRLYAEQLSKQLQESLHPCYLLFGNDLLLLQESQNCIRDYVQKQQFNEHFSVTLDTKTDWDTIFNLCQTRSLFTNRQTLTLILPDCVIQSAMEEKLLRLASLLHKDLLLILRGGKVTNILENSDWFKMLSPQSVLVRCVTPERTHLPQWVAKRAKRMNLTLDDDACQTLCYYYEGNLLALTQILEQLSLIYPDGILTTPRIKIAINDNTHFTTLHWIEAVLEGKSNRAVHVLRQLQLAAVEPVILLRRIQHEILRLVTLKRQITTAPLRKASDHYKVGRDNYQLSKQQIACHRLTMPQLRDAVALMTHIELALKQDYDGYHVWPDLNALALLLCGKILPTTMTMING